MRLCAKKSFENELLKLFFPSQPSFISRSAKTPFVSAPRNRPNASRSVLRSSNKEPEEENGDGSDAAVLMRSRDGKAWKAKGMFQGCVIALRGG
jgi:hypothetical protein